MNNSWSAKGFNAVGVNDGFFDDIIEYLDLPFEEVEGDDCNGSTEDVKETHLPAEENNEGDEEWDCNFDNLEPPPTNVLAGLSSGFYDDFFSDSLEKSLTISCDGSSELNQQSSNTKAASSTRRSITLHSESTDVKGSTWFQTSSTVSEIESSSSCSGGLIIWLVLNQNQKAILQKNEPKETEEEKNLTLLSSSSEIKKSCPQQPTVVMKCMHCEITETPQWREGPMGPKTLCNACGVRYRSGRLFPEYRPAASPTFIPSLHSNCHKKVVEMRKKIQAAVVKPPQNVVLVAVENFSD
ncbi:Detected protein of unknown function [Hibiscus syriacus]|uniref:GATA-type domain-containing protein n=1 Tax=Hibiscus syriacus TaxID=106335 RepID=A0A6A2XNG1_HIBSY|nr:Detected protein of unknown function [Hibiscus syriacus]